VAESMQFWIKQEFTFNIFHAHGTRAKTTESVNPIMHEYSWEDKGFEV
jgi:hypothetical protein